MIEHARISHPGPEPEARAEPTPPGLSIVIPAYNEERRLPRTLAEIARWVTAHGGEVEVIVAENASTDRTADIVRAFAADHPYVRLLAGLPKGKGSAVRAGMLAAHGAWRFLCDADLSMPIDELDKFLPVADAGADVAIGSREAPGARRFGEPGYRHLMGRVFNGVVKLAALPGLEDTQCGFKLFRAGAAEDLFRASTLSGFGFDAEVLYVARKRGFRVVEVPIDWHFNADSRVRPIRDTLEMVRDLLRVRLNDRRGAYGG